MARNWSDLFKKQSHSLDQPIIVKCQHGFAPNGCYHCMKANPPEDLNNESSDPFTGLSDLKSGYNKTEKL